MPSPPKAPTLNFIASLNYPIRWAVGAGLMAAVTSLFMPNYYRSEARLLPVESKGVGGSLGGLATAAAAFGVSVPGGDSSDANFVDVLNSRWLREKLLTTEFQYRVPSRIIGADRGEKKTLYAYLEAKNMDQALRSIGPILSSSRDLKSKIISISAETTSPELSQLITQQAIQLLETFNRDKGRTRGGAKAAFAEARLFDARQEMDEAEDAFRRFLEANRNFQASGDPAVRLKGTRLESEFRLRQQLVTSIAMNREQALLEEKNDIPILNMLDPGNLPIDKSKPARATIVLVTMMLMGAGSWAWLNRDWVRALLMAGEEEVSPSVKEQL